MKNSISTPIFSLDSGDLSLDFANTFDPRRGQHPQDKLTSYDALLAFASQSGLIDANTAKALDAWSIERPHEARAIHARAIALREAIFGAAGSVANHRDPDPADLELLAREMAAALGHARLAVTPEGFDWRWDVDDAHPEQPLRPIAHAASHLLTAHDLGRLRVCAADDCDWLFYDTTRNQSRKWCDMATCGNRAKMARHRGNRD